MDACNPRWGFLSITAGLVPAIHAEQLGVAFGSHRKQFGVDARDKPGHDGVIAARP